MAATGTRASPRSHRMSRGELSPLISFSGLRWLAPCAPQELALRDAQAVELGQERLLLRVARPASGRAPGRLGRQDLGPALGLPLPDPRTEFLPGDHRASDSRRSRARA